MTRLRILYIVCLLACALALAPQSMAADAAIAKKPAPVGLQYIVYWGGIEAGKISLTFQESAHAYQDKIDISTSGFLKKLLRFNIIATGTGRIKSQTAQTESYRYTSIRRKKTKDYRWVYDADAHLARTPDNPNTEKTIGDHLRKDVLDPFGALMQTIHVLRETKGADDPRLHAIIPLFDGKRRFDITLKDYQRHIVTIGKRQQKAIELSLQIDPKAGFDKEDKEDEIWGSAKIQLLLTDDGMYYPLRVVATTSMGPAIIQLLGGCIGETACKPRDL